jgi:hypothetical protein
MCHLLLHISFAILPNSHPRNAVEGRVGAPNPLSSNPPSLCAALSISLPSGSLSPSRHPPSDTSFAIISPPSQIKTNNDDKRNRYRPEIMKAVHPEDNAKFTREEMQAVTTKARHCSSHRIQL